MAVKADGMVIPVRKRRMWLNRCLIKKQETFLSVLLFFLSHDDTANCYQVDFHP